MGELTGQITIVGEQQHTRRIAVKTSHRIDALRTCILHEVHDGLALLRVVTGSDEALRLIEQHINFLLKRDGLVVELHLVGTMHLSAQLGHYGTIDRDYSGLDILICLTTTAHTGIGQILVQTNGLIGIDVILLILDALLLTVLCIGIVIGRMLTIAVLTICTGTIVATFAVATPPRLIAITTVATVPRLVAALTIVSAAWLITTLLLVAAIVWTIAATAWLIATLLVASRLIATTLLIATSLLGITALTVAARTVTALTAIALTRLIATLRSIRTRTIRTAWLGIRG